jgi:peptidoglycan hydrolase CwlO-like protein
MEQEHDRLMGGIDPTQQQRGQEQIRNMTQLRQQLNAQLQQLDPDVDSAQPNPKRITDRTREIERRMSQWQQQHRILSSNSGV